MGGRTYKRHLYYAFGHLNVGSLTSLCSGMTPAVNKAIRFFWFFGVESLKVFDEFSCDVMLLLKGTH